MKTVCAVLISFGLITLAAPPVAAADSLEISTSADPTEDIAFQLMFSGATGRGDVFVSIKPTGGRPCAANPEADDGSQLVDGEFHQGAFRESLNTTTSQSGAYLLCGWVRPENSTGVSASTQLVIGVRAPFATVTPRPPVEVGAGGRFPLQLAVQTELGRDVFEAINAPGIPCGANRSANRSVEEVIDGQYTTGGPFILTTNVQAPSSPGRYTVCAYVQENDGETAPEAVGSAPLVVFAQRCRKAQTDLGIFSARVTSLTRLLARPTSLRRGAKGARVKQVQKRLRLKQTGNYTRITVRAVKRFQRRARLKRTGVVDRGTAAKMRLRLFDSVTTRRTWKRDLDAAAKSRRGSRDAVARYCR